MTDPLTARLSEPEDGCEYDLILRLDMVQIASCGCDTKTHEIKYHDQLCRYRVLEEARLAILAKDARIDALLAGRTILIAERAEARALLEPFAKVCAALDDDMADLDLVPLPDDMDANDWLDPGDINLGHFRAARAYLTKETSDVG